MVSKDVLGYPIKNEFQFKGLKMAYIAAMGALDLGDFETKLKELAQFTYESALIEMEKLGERQESRIIKGAKVEAEKGGIEQYQDVAETLRMEGDEYKAGAFEALISELIAERNKPKKVARQPKKKAEPAPISKPPTKLEQFEQQKTHGEDFDWLHKFIISDGLDDLAEASRLVELPDTKLSTEERGFLSGLIEQKRQEALAIHPKVEIEVLKKITHKKPEKASEIRTSRELTKKREEKEQGIERERLPEFQAVQYTYQSINPENGRRFFRQYQKYLPEILRGGIGNWLEVHREVYVFPLTSKNIFALATALEYGLKSPVTLREVVAQRVVLKHTLSIIEQGVNYGTSQYDFKKDYTEFNAENKLPEFNKFKQIVIDLISSGKIFSFE